MFSTSWLVHFFLLLALLSVSVRAEDDPKFNNTVYLIRNGEMNSRKAGSGLSPNGTARADCLMNVFGPDTNRTVGFIISEPPKRNGNVSEALDTVTPLATALNIPIDTSCARDDKDCVLDALKKFAKKNPGVDMLVCWSPDLLPDIADDLGVNDVPDWPNRRFDLIWTVHKRKLINKSSEACPGLDDPELAICSDLD